MGKKQNRLLKKQRNEEQRDRRNLKRSYSEQKMLRKQAALTVLAKHREPKKPPTKKCSFATHASFFYPIVQAHHCIRDPAKWEAKTFNMYRQRIAYLQWVLCKYRVPTFLLDTFIGSLFKKNGGDAHRKNIAMFQTWARSVGNGGSLYKIAKDLLTKKECHHFLQFPDGDAATNIWRARCVRNNIRPKLAKSVVQRLHTRGTSLHDAQWIEFIDFLGKNQDEFDPTSIMEIMDFLHVQFPQLRTLKGRTVSSLTRMSNDWHRVMGRTKFKGEYIEWEGSGIPTWRFQFKDDPTVWYISEILDSKDLYTEGNKLRHCVGGYSRSCKEGRMNIFSLRKKQYADASIFYRRVTIEVLSGAVRQARRKLNKKPTEEEMTLIRRWARDNKFSCSNSVFSWAW